MPVIITVTIPVAIATSTYVLLHLQFKPTYTKCGIHYLHEVKSMKYYLSYKNKIGTESLTNSKHISSIGAGNFCDSYSKNDNYVFSS